MCRLTAELSLDYSSHFSLSCPVPHRRRFVPIFGKPSFQISKLQISDPKIISLIAQFKPCCLAWSNAECPGRLLAIRANFGQQQLQQRIATAITRMKQCGQLFLQRSYGEKVYGWSPLHSSFVKCLITIAGAMPNPSLSLLKGAFIPLLRCRVPLCISSLEVKKSTKIRKTRFDPLKTLFFMSDSYSQEVDVRALHHRREINKKTRSGDKKLRKQLKTAKKVGSFIYPLASAH